MLTIQITRFGQTVRMEVEQFEVVRNCPYCRVEFTTVDPDQVYCKTSHRVMACQVRTFSRNLPAALAATSVGMSRLLTV